MRSTLLSAGALLSILAGQTLPAQGWLSKIQPALHQQMQSAAPNAKLPVYFVLGDRLGYTHFFPRVQGMEVNARRALVVAELQQHAQRTQAPLLAELAAQQAAGEIADIQPCWLANLVLARCSVAAIESLAPRDDVSEIWPKTTPTLAEVEDRDPYVMVQGGGTPGDGPRLVGADRVWALGITGQGVVVMNADSGINVQHQALQNQLWVNPGEVAGNGLDDDGNGLIDDIHGWDFGGNSANLDDAGGHGTNTAGCLVADNTCLGTTYGVAPGAKVMTGKLLDETSQWFAIQYALLQGAHSQTSSHSYKNNVTSPPNYKVHRDVADLTLAAGLIRTNSTSNNGAACTLNMPIQRPFNVSLPGAVPAPYLDANQTLIGRKSGVLGIGGHRRDGLRDPNSPCGPSAWYLADLLAVLPTYPSANWSPLHDDYPWTSGTQLGLLKPDVCAPLGTQTTGGAGATCLIIGFSGTSNATPIANGCLCLWKSANPSLTPEDLAMIVHQSSQDAGVVPGKENDWGVGKIDAYAGVLMAMNVHRVNSDPAYEVLHRGGTAVTLEIDGLPGRPALLAIGLVRQVVDFGIVKSGIGMTMFCAFAGMTDAAGSARVTLPVPPVAAPVTLFSQSFVDDRVGTTGLVLASNVIGIKVVP